jgi:hypothetical protein
MTSRRTVVPSGTFVVLRRAAVMAMGANCLVGACMAFSGFDRETQEIGRALAAGLAALTVLILAWRRRARVAGTEG